MNVELIVSVGALLLSVFVIFSRAVEKNITIREHKEFRKNIQSSVKLLRKTLKREVDRVERRLDRIEDTRPTTGELKAQINRPGSTG